MGEAANAAATIAEVAAQRPDILLLDVSMPGGGGIAALDEIRKASPATRILVLTMHEDPAYLRVALVSGASGFLLKHAAGRELVAAIRAVLPGAHLRRIPRWPASRCTRRCGRRSSRRRLEECGTDRLSPRETQVLRDLALGFANRKSRSAWP